MTRVACCACSSALLLFASGTSAASAGSVTVLRTTIGPTQLQSQDFGYSVAYRMIESGGRIRNAIHLFVYDRGRWRDATPSALAADGIDAIDDVAFVDRVHGWVAAYNCARARVYLYRTSDGGRSWQPLGAPASHSCGGGPTYLSFPDELHGWMEPVSPNGPAGELLGTSDGGRTWKQLTTTPPCLAPIRFVSRSTGWMGRCVFGRPAGAAYATHDGGRRWKPVSIPVPDTANARFDVPRFFGSTGVVAATIGKRPADEPGATQSVAFSTTRDGGSHWSLRSVRAVGACPMSPYSSAVWPAAVAGPRTWWIVGGARRPVVQVSIDGGQRWRAVIASGLPGRGCSVVTVSAAGARTAWVVARERGYNTALFQSTDGGRTWARARPSRG